MHHTLGSEITSLISNTNLQRYHKPPHHSAKTFAVRTSSCILHITMNVLRRLLFVIEVILLSCCLIFTTKTTHAQQYEYEYECDPPVAGCSNGMFNSATCECECIIPFCHDSNGQCYSTVGCTNKNVWKDCVRGYDCPWWVNIGRSESCITGPNVRILYIL